MTSDPIKKAYRRLVRLASNIETRGDAVKHTDIQREIDTAVGEIFQHIQECEVDGPLTKNSKHKII